MISEDHVTLNTGGMMLLHGNQLYFNLQYIEIKSVILNCNTISQY